MGRKKKTEKLEEKDLRDLSELLPVWSSSSFDLLTSCCPDFLIVFFPFFFSFFSTRTCWQLIEIYGIVFHVASNGFVLNANANGQV